MSGCITELQLDGNCCIVLDGFGLIVQIADAVLNNQIERSAITNRVEVAVTGVGGGHAVAAHVDRVRRKGGGECSPRADRRYLADAVHGDGDSTGWNEQIQLNRSADCRWVSNRHWRKRVKVQQRCCLADAVGLRV